MKHGSGILGLDWVEGASYFLSHDNQYFGFGLGMGLGKSSGLYIASMQSEILDFCTSLGKHVGL